MAADNRHHARLRAAAVAGVGAGHGGASLAHRIPAWLHPVAAARAEADSRRLFHWLPVAMGIGIVLAFQADGTPSAWPPLALAAVLSGLAAWQRAHLARFATLAALAALCFGFAAACWRTMSVAAPVLDRPAFARLTAFVEQVDAGPQGGRMVLRLTSMDTAFAVVRAERVRVTFRGPGPRAGDHIAGQARLMPPPQPSFPGGYDFARDAYFLGLGGVGRWTGPVALSPAPMPMPQGVRLWAAIDNARNDMTQRIASVIGGQAGALSAALVTGKRGLIEERVNDDMRAAGIYHIVSISGLHMVLAAGVFFWLARALLALLPGVAERWPIKKIAAVIAMGGATAYCIFSGSEVATERSLVMTLVMLGAILVDRPAISMRNLAISALIVLAREPETLLGPSFQMSFAAVAGMIAANEWWRERRREPREPGGFGGILLRRMWVVVLASLATTLIASLATAPFAAYHFQRLNPYGLIGNALAIPFVSFVVMPAAVAGTLLLPFGLDGPVWTLMGQGSVKVIEVARYVAQFAGSVRGVPAFGSGALVVMSLGLVVLLLPRTPMRLAGAVAIAAGAAMAATPPRPDVLVDREGKLAVLRGADGRYLLLGKTSSRFTIDRWLASDGDMRAASDPTLRTGAQCDALGCVGRLHDGAAVALVLDPGGFEEDCARAALVVTPLVAPPFCARATDVVDREALQRFASVALERRDAKFVLKPARPQIQWKPWYGRPRDAAPASTPSGEVVREENPQAPPIADDGSDLLTP